MPNIKPNAERWPRNLDDMRADPSRIVTLADLARLGIVRTYDGAKWLPAPLKRPSTPKCWEARTILQAMGLPEPDTAVRGVCSYRGGKARARVRLKNVAATIA